MHGALRNAGDYFRSIRQASHRLVVAPQFLTEDDVRGHEERSGHLRWDTEDWKGGRGDVSSFTVMDELLRQLKAFRRLDKSISSSENFRRYTEREVVYLLGEEDADPGAVLLEIHPAAEVQGRTRRERGENYHRYLAFKAGKPVHDLVHVPGVGHDAAAMFSSPQGRRYLFDGDR